jgi:hypothetical protein
LTRDGHDSLLGYETTDGTACRVNHQNHNRSILKDEFRSGCDESESQSKYDCTLHDLPKSQGNSNDDKSTAVPQRGILIDSADQLVNFLSHANSKDLSTKENSHLKTCTQTKTGDVRSSMSKSYKPPEMSDPEVTDSFKTYARQFTSDDSKSDEWKSKQSPSGIYQEAKGNHEESKYMAMKTETKKQYTSKETHDSKCNGTSNLSNSKTKEAMNPNDSFLNHNSKNNIDLRTSMPPKHAGNEVHLHPLTSTTELPPWPDSNQGYPHYQVQPFHGNFPYCNQGLPSSHNFTNGQNQRLMGNGGFYQHRPQYPFQQNMANPNVPLVNNAFHVPGITYQPMGWHPRQNLPYNGQTSYSRAAFQPGTGLRQPMAYFRSPGQNQNSKMSNWYFILFLPKEKSINDQNSLINVLCLCSILKDSNKKRRDSTTTW